MSLMIIEVIAAYAVSILIASLATRETNRRLNALRSIQQELGVEKHLIPDEITWYSNRRAINWARKHIGKFSEEKARLIESALRYEAVGWSTLFLPLLWITMRILFDG